MIDINIRRFSCQEARCVLQTSCSHRLPEYYPLLDSPDPSKTQSALCSVLQLPPASQGQWIGLYCNHSETPLFQQAEPSADVKALETMVEDTESEVANLKRSKVANMVKMYQGAPV